ncbi:ATP-binding protein [Planococcus versutus]|uniref:histidine kinase n=1 Tax=Planococcus versutus TaxID=1302659 RepID=A0A1B1S312_9BACL|nr:sensor histidine kinase [Planococcus versutus]ANU27572.1 ATPase [Planococcus versutus]
MARILSLRTKILLFGTFVILVSTTMYGSILAYKEVTETKEAIGIRALETAVTIANMPSIVDAMDDEHPEDIIQPIAKYISSQLEAEFIVVGNMDSIRYSHPNPAKIGKKMVGGDNDRALLHGESYVSEATGSMGRSLRGKAPIYNNTGERIGIVSVGYMSDDIYAVILKNIAELVLFALLALIVGVIGSFLLAKNIRKETMGLEPREIAALFRDREALLASIIEGVVAIDQDGRITSMNQSAQAMLNLDELPLNAHIDEVLPDSKMREFFKAGPAVRNEEMLLENKVLILNRTFIYGEDDEVVGIVSTFRDKTDIQEMLRALSEIQQYSESLRAQTHEYTNKLYAVSGLLELGQTEEAIDLLQMEKRTHKVKTEHMLEQIHDKKVQAILLGKMGKASEQKVEFSIDANSSLTSLPAHIDILKIINILGNLIDNAIEEVTKKMTKEISFFITDIGNDVVIEVEDNGTGFSEEEINQLFAIGFSTKLEKKDRGYGLAIVKQAVDDLKGTIEVYSNHQDKTVFTVFLPK